MDRLRLFASPPRSCGGDLFNPFEDEQQKKLNFIAYTVICPIIVTIGILGNGINVLILSYPSILKGATKIYITALTLGDLCALLIAIPMLQRLNKAHYQSLAAATYYAHFEVYLIETFLRFSIFIVICLSFDRYLAVCLPEKFNNYHATKLALKVVISCFAAASIITIPLIFIKQPCILEEKDGMQIWDIRDNPRVTKMLVWYVYIWSYEIITRYGSFVILAVLNISIIGKYKTYIKKRKELFQKRQNGSNTNLHLKNGEQQKCIYLRERKQKEEKRLIYMLEAIVLLFYLTMTPAAAFSIINHTTNNKNYFRFDVFWAVGNILELLYFTLNFFIYSFCNREFCSILKNIVCRM